MPPSFQEILNSRPFTFVVGLKVDGSPKEFLVHSEPFAQLSKPLDILIKESPDRSTTWDNVSKETFAQFAQFAYTGDYSIPETEPRGKASKQILFPSTALNGYNQSEDLNGERIVDPEVVPNNYGEGPNGLEPVAASQIEGAKDKKKKKKKKKKAAESTTEEKPAEAIQEEAAESVIPEDQAQSTTQEPPAEPLPQEEPEPEPAEPSIPEQPAESVTQVGSDTQESPDLDSTMGIQEDETETPTQHDLPSYPPSITAYPSNNASTNFSNLSFPLLAPLNPYQATCTPAATFNSGEDYTPLLTSHASLHHLAATYSIPSLQVLTLHKLHQTLKIFELSDETAGDIAALARCAYAEEGAGGDDGVGTGSGLGLRGLICRYMAANAQVLLYNEEFMNLLAGGGQLVKDFFRCQVQGRGLVG